MPATFQKNHPTRGPANFPMAINERVGGFCNPRSQREIVIDEQRKRLPNSAWLSCNRLRNSRICLAQVGSGLQMYSRVFPTATR